MTNPPGEGPTPPEPNEPQPSQPEPSQPQSNVPPPSQPQSNEPQPGYWEQQAWQQGQQGQPGQQPPYPPQGYPGQAGYQYAPDHPRATTSLVLGILGVVLCQILAPFAWSMGKKTLDEIDASQGQVGGRGAAQAGYVQGIVGTVLLGLGIIFGILWIILIVVVGGISTTTNY